MSDKPGPKSTKEETSLEVADLAGFPATAAGLDQVREILFGQHSRSQEQRLKRVEERLEIAITQINDDTTRRLDGLEAYIKNELTMLIEKLGTQREERSALFQQMKGEFEGSTKKFEERLREFSDRTTKTQTDLRTELLRQLNAVTDEVETRAESLAQDLSNETAQLRNDLVDRASISSLLSEMALKLNESLALDTDHAGDDGALIGDLLGGATVTQD